MPTPTAGYTIAGASSATTAPLPVQATQADHAADYIAMYSSAAAGTVAINLANLLGTVSQTMGTTDTQTVSNKANNNTNTYATKDTSLVLQSAGDATKTFRFLASNITAGQLRSFILPDYNGTIATQGGSEVLTNKTLTSPIINNATITSDMYTGFSDSDSGFIFGMQVTNGILQSAALVGKVNTAAIVDASVTPTKLATGAATASVVTSETTTSTSFVDLATPGPAVTVTIGANGLALLIITADQFNATAGATSFMGCVLSGSNTEAASATNAYSVKNVGGSLETNLSFVRLLTGLSPGSTTFTAKYAVSSNTSTFTNRKIAVVPL